jgi:hypothetical protein
MHDFIMVFPYIPMLYPGLVHYFQYYPSFFTCLLKITSTGFNVLYAYMYRKCQPYSPSFTFLIYPSSLAIIISLTWLVSHSCSSLFKCLLIVQWEFGLGILHVNMLCFNQSNLVCYSSSPFPHAQYFQFFNSLQCFLFLP